MQNTSDTSASAAVPPSREHIHSRNIAANAYLRSDGLWDIECELTDTKSYAFENADGKKLAQGEPVHRMRVRLAIDDHLLVREAVAEMPDTPFPECTEATAPFTGLIGLRIAKGWRRAIEESMGKCVGWDFNGPVVARIAPQFIGYAADLLRPEQRKLP